MTDPLLDMMGDVSIKPMTVLDNAAADIIESIYLLAPSLLRLPEQDLNQIVKVAFGYAEDRVRKVTN